MRPERFVMNILYTVSAYTRRLWIDSIVECIGDISVKQYHNNNRWTVGMKLRQTQFFVFFSFRRLYFYALCRRRRHTLWYYSIS